MNDEVRGSAASARAASSTLLERDELSFRSFWVSVWRQRVFLVSVTVVSTVVAFGAALLWPKSYVAVVLVSPVGEDGATSKNSGLGALVSQFGGTASLAALSLSGASSKKAESVALLQSELLTERYISEHNLLPVLYARKWDSAHQRWNASNAKNIPTLWKANQYFKKSIRSVASDPKNGLLTLTISWKDPRLAAEWANGLVRLTNEYGRDRAIRESERNIAYLNDVLAKTNVVEVQKSIYSLMESEINREMMARGTDEYALRVIDPAVTPEKPTFPLPGLWATLGFGAGLLVSLFIALLR